MLCTKLSPKGRSSSVILFWDPSDLLAPLWLVDAISGNKVGRWPFICLAFESLLIMLLLLAIENEIRLMERSPNGIVLIRPGSGGILVDPIVVFFTCKSGLLWILWVAMDYGVVVSAGLWPRSPVAHVRFGLWVLLLYGLRVQDVSDCDFVVASITL